MSKPKKCPKCNSDKVLKILYGLPTDDAMNDPDLYLGGCCIFGNDPMWHCSDCGWQWGSGPDGVYNKDEVE